MSSNIIPETQFFFSDRLFDNCGHKIGRKRSLLSSSYFNCTHTAPPDHLLSLTNCTSKEGFAPPFNTLNIIGPTIYLFPNLDWKLVNALDEAKGIFHKDSFHFTPNLFSYFETLSTLSSSFSSLFEFENDSVQFPSADDEIDYLYPNKNRDSLSPMLKAPELIFGPEDNYESKLASQTYPKVGRPRGSGKKRGSTNRRRGSRGYIKRKRSPHSSQFISPKKPHHSDNLESTNSDSSEYDADEKEEQSDSTNSITSVSFEENLEIKSESDHIEDEEIKDLLTLNAPRRRGRKPKSYLRETSSEDEKLEGEAAFPPKVPTLRIRNLERPVYNTFRRARGSSRGRGYKKPITSIQTGS